MKELKEYAAAKANELYDEDGVFWSGRYRSIAILDEAALLATSIYIDLNPFAAGMVQLPEQAEFSSLRIRAASRITRADRPQAAPDLVATGTERSSWLCPIDDRIGDGQQARCGLLEGLSLDQYLQLLDETSRRKRPGKAKLSASAQAILERLSTKLESLERSVRLVLGWPTNDGNLFLVSQAVAPRSGRFPWLSSRRQSQRLPDGREVEGR